MALDRHSPPRPGGTCDYRVIVRLAEEMKITPRTIINDYRNRTYPPSLSLSDAYRSLRRKFFPLVRLTISPFVNRSPLPCETGFDPRNGGLPLLRANVWVCYYLNFLKNPIFSPFRRRKSNDLIFLESSGALSFFVSLLDIRHVGSKVRHRGRTCWNIPALATVFFLVIPEFQVSAYNLLYERNMYPPPPFVVVDKFGIW